MTETSRAKNPLTNWRTGYDDNGICQPHNDPYVIYRGSNVVVNMGNRHQEIGTYMGLDSHYQLVLRPSIVRAYLKEGENGPALRLEKRRPTLVSLGGVVSVNAIRQRDIEAIIQDSMKQEKASESDTQSPTQ